MFTDPAPFPYDITFGVQSKDDKPLANKGNLRFLSPEEPVNGFIFKIEEEIEQGVPSARLTEWRTVLETAKCNFQRCDRKEDVFFHGWKQRKLVYIQAKGVVRSEPQNAYAVTQYKQDREKVLGKQTYKMIAETFGK